MPRHLFFRGAPENRRLLSLVTLLVLVYLPLPCFGGGVLHVFPPQLNGETVAVARPSVLLSKTLVTVDESSVEYRFDQTFFNDNDFRLEGLFVLPLKADDMQGNPEVTVNGKPYPFEVVAPDRFFTTLRDLTTAAKDPSLLGLTGESVLLLRPLYMEPRGQKSIRVQFKKRILLRDDQLEIDVPLIGEQYSLGPVGELEIRVRFKMSRSVRTLFSPTHHLAVFRETPRRCLVTTERSEKKVREDFRLLTTFSGEGLNLRIFPYKTPGGPGTFMAFVEPPLNQAPSAEYDKNVVFLLDASGSLGKVNLELAKRLMVSGLERLRPRDAFNVLIMGTSVKRLAGALLPATPENAAEAVRFVNAVTPSGGTDLCNGLVYALDEFTSRNRPNIVVMAGDGRGTVGTTHGEAIVEEVRKNNKNKARIFVLGLGDGADMATLDKIAVSTNGTSIHYAGGEDFPAVMNRFFAGVSPPQVSDLSLRFLDFTPEAVQPDPVPDVFGRDSVVIFGRYRTDNDVPWSMRLRGKIKGKVKTLTKTFTLPVSDERRPYIEELWAMRHMGVLLDQEMLKGAHEDVTSRIRKLARRFGFKVPDTSLTTPFPGGAQRVSDPASLLWRFKTSLVTAEVESNRYKKAHGKVFRFDGHAWVDTIYAGQTPLTPFKFLSPRYFALLSQNPSLGSCFALGPNLTIIHNGKAIQVASDISEAVPANH
jgi:Ca-activated chloride channel homolog